MALAPTDLHTDFVFPGTTPGTQISHCHYFSADALATIAAANYFNGVASLLPKGSIIDVVGALGGTPVHQQYVVTANTGTVVTIAATT